MRLVLILLCACVILAVVKVAFAALLILLLIALIWGVCLHSREVIGFLTFCAALSLIKAHPAPCLLIAGAVAVGARVAGKRPKPGG